MKKIFFAFIALLFVNVAFAQFVAKLEVKGPLPGACDSANVYAIFPGFKGQVAPVAPKTDKQIEKMLNEDVAFLSANPKFSGKMMIHCIVSCKGEMIVCEVDNKSGNDELDQQILAVFKTLTKWTPGTLNGEAVDCSVLFSMEIKKGKITL
jgi:hypothetical protein